MIESRRQTAAEVAQWVKGIHDGGLDGPNGLNGPRGLGGSDRPAGPENKSTRSIQFIRPTDSTASAFSVRLAYPEIAANTALTLIDVASSLLARQLAAQAKAFENEGGFTERLHRIRATRRRDT